MVIWRMKQECSQVISFPWSKSKEKGGQGVVHPTYQVSRKCLLELQESRHDADWLHVEISLN